MKNFSLLFTRPYMIKPLLPLQFYAYHSLFSHYTTTTLAFFHIPQTNQVHFSFTAFTLEAASAWNVLLMANPFSSFRSQVKNHLHRETFSVLSESFYVVSTWALHLNLDPSPHFFIFTTLLINYLVYFFAFHLFSLFSLSTPKLQYVLHKSRDSLSYLPLYLYYLLYL